jgi:chitodextrinase
MLLKSITRICICTGIFLLAASSVSADTFTTKQLITNADSVPPTIPGGVIATGIAPAQIDLSWTASTDNVAVLGYVLSRNGFIIATVTAPQTTYSDTGLTASTTYMYTLSAFDGNGNYSTSSATATASTLPIIVPTSTSPIQTQGGTTNHLIILTVGTTPGSDRALIETETSVPTLLKISWGRTYDATEGTIDVPLYKKKESTLISDLLPNTDYWVVVEATDVYGATAEKRIRFHTLSDVRETVLANPGRFSANPAELGINLSWKNPTDPRFREVRLIRKEGDIPTDPYDGVPIYEGSNEGVMDTSVEDGRIYGYALFARGDDGTFSSGAVLVVRAYSKQTIGDAGVVIPRGTTENNFLKALTIVQDGIARSVDGVKVRIASDRGFTLSLPASAVPHVLKTIIITMRDPQDYNKTFSFLLRINAAGDAYEARIGALGQEGTFETALSVLNAETQSIESAAFVIESEQLEGRQHSAGVARTMNIKLLFVYLGFLTMLFTILARLLRGSRSNKEVIAPTK